MFTNLQHLVDAIVGTWDGSQGSAELTVTLPDGTRGRIEKLETADDGAVNLVVTSES